MHDDAAGELPLDLDHPEPSRSLTRRERRSVSEGTGVHVRRIQELVGQQLGVTRGAILSRTRIRTVVRAPHMSMGLARVLTIGSYPDLGRAFHRDHTTVLYAARRFRGWIEKDEHEARQVAIAVYRVFPGLPPIPTQDEFMDRCRRVTDIPPGHWLR